MCNGIPVIGWVFKDSWGENKQLLNDFLNASTEAKQMMNESDDIWKKVRPYMNLMMTIFLVIFVIFTEKVYPKINSCPQVKGAKKALLYPI